MLRTKLKTIKETIPSITRQKVNEAFTFVEKLTYLDKVQMTQKKVLEAKVVILISQWTKTKKDTCFQDALQEIGEHKRTIHRELSSSRRLFDDVREDIRTTNRFHERQVELWEKEKDLALKITQYEQKLIDVDDRERLCFINLTSAINSTYEVGVFNSFHTSFLTKTFLGWKASFEFPESLGFGGNLYSYSVNLHNFADRILLPQ